MARLFILTIKVHIKKTERFRHFWRRHNVIKIVRNDVIRKKWWPHNVKNVGIVMNFVCELVSSKWVIVPIFREIGSEEVYFLKIVGYDVIRRFSAEVCFLKNIGFDVIPQKWWRHNSVKMLVSIWILCGEFLLQNWRSGSIFSHIEWVEPCFPKNRHFVKFSLDCRYQKRRHVSPTN